MDAVIISIGDELLIGQVVNSNASYIGEKLSALGIAIKEVIVVPDTEEAIRNALTDATMKADVILTTGGLGPTKDDVTQSALAAHFGVELIFSESMYETLTTMIRQWGREPTESHRAQCFLPSNARLIRNGRGTAPGMWFEENDTLLFVMPGVPYEMRHIMKNGVLTELERRITGGTRMVQHTIATVGEGESRLAARIADIEEGLPANMKLAYLPSPGKVRVRLTARIAKAAQVNQFEQLADDIAARLDEFVFAREDISLAEAVGRSLKASSLTLAVAESCTGGFLSHLITAVPGSSAYFEGGAVTYSNALKKKVLGVSADTLAVHGAVSEATVREMAEGALSAFNTDLALAVTGIAGPEGGSELKPVGTVWLAVAGSRETFSKKFVFPKGRLRNIELSATAGLNMVRKYLMRFQ